LSFKPFATAVEILGNPIPTILSMDHYQQPTQQKPARCSSSSCSRTNKMSDFFQVVLNHQPKVTHGEFPDHRERSHLNFGQARPPRLRYDIEESCFIMYYKLIIDSKDWRGIELDFSKHFPEGEPRRCRSTLANINSSRLSDTYGNRSRQGLESEYLRVRELWGLNGVRADADPKATKSLVEEILKNYGYWPGSSPWIRTYQPC